MFLRFVTRSRDYETSIYEVRGKDSDILNVYVFSSEPTRRVINKPEIVGYEFGGMLRGGIEEYLMNIPPDEKEKIRVMDERDINICIIMRGGLNFDPSEALYKTFGINRASISFLTSQRYRDENGEWHVRDNEYTKIVAKPGMMVFMGDIIATGTTFAQSMERLIEGVKSKGGSIKQIYVFTVGSDRAIDIADEYSKYMLDIFPEYEGTQLIFMEGIFGLAEEDKGPSIRTVSYTHLTLPTKA